MTVCGELVRWEGRRSTGFTRIDAEHHEHCRVCAEACRRREQACANLLESLN